MISLNGWRVAAIAALFSLLPLCAAQAAEQHIGVVNIPRIFEGYQRAKDIQEKLKKEFGPEESALEKTNIELRKMKDRLEVDPRSKTDLGYYSDFQKLQYATLELENRRRDVVKRAQDRQRDEMKVLLVEIRNAVRVVSTAEGLSFILRAPEWEDRMGGAGAGPQFNAPVAGAEGESEDIKEPKTAQQLIGLFRESPLVHFDPSTDITEKVIARLNADYAKLKK
jgi:Skp family chaperone for outer membrane proteins